MIFALIGIVICAFSCGWNAAQLIKYKDMQAKLDEAERILTAAEAIRREAYRQLCQAAEERQQAGLILHDAEDKMLKEREKR